MAADISELKSEVRAFASAADALADSGDLDAVVNRAKRHIRTEKGITDDNFDWFADQYREEALFWFTCLFSKVATGEIDAQTVSVGSIDIRELSGEDRQATIWSRKATKALRNFDSGGDYPFGFGMTAPTRDNRVYGGDDTGGDTDLGELNQ